MRGRKRKLEPTDGLPAQWAPPDYLTAGAKARFRQVVAQLDARGALADTDFGVLARYAAVFDRWTQAEAILAASGDGLHYARLTDRAGKPASSVALPAMRQADSCAAQLAKLEAVLGLNPVERGRLPDKGGADEPDEFDEMMAAIDRPG
jgi:P27 family predicted phage terminase small subunit